MKWLNIMETEHFCDFVSQESFLLLIVNKSIFWDVSIFPEIHKISFLESFYFISLILGEI